VWVRVFRVVAITGVAHECQVSAQVVVVTGVAGDEGHKVVRSLEAASLLGRHLLTLQQVCLINLMLPFLASKKQCFGT